MLEQAKRGAHSTNGGSDRARGDKPAVRDWWGVTWHHTFLAHSAVRVVCVWLCVAVWLWLRASPLADLAAAIVRVVGMGLALKAGVFIAVRAGGTALQAWVPRLAAASVSSDR